MGRVQLAGGAYQARSVIASAQRALNLFAEPMAEAQGEPARAAHYPTPGLRLWTTLPQGPIRALRQAQNGTLYAVGGSGVYAVTPTVTSLGTIAARSHQTPVSMSDNGLSLVIVDGSSSGWAVTLTDNSFAAIADPTGTFAGADRVDYLDTFFLFNKPNTPQFYASDSLALTFDPLYFANKESAPDNLVAVVVSKREIWLLGERTSEIFFNSGATDFPFQAQGGVFVDHGCIARYSPAEMDNTVFWLSQDRAGQGIVLTGASYQTKRISTYAIEAELSTYSTLADAVGWTYQLGGHAFYVLSFPTADKTWVYDTTTGHWHEWAWLDANGDEHRHRGNCAAYVTGTGVVVGDRENGNLYVLDPEVFTDNGTPIKRVRSFPHLLNDGKRVFFRQFMADFEAGNAPQAAVSTITEQIVTWLPDIARMTGVSVGAISGTTGGAFIDWPRGLVYMVGQTGYQKFNTALETQAPLVTVATPGTRFVFGADVDPLSGCLIVQTDPGNPNGVPIYKLDPNTFAVLDTFGVATSGPSYPASVWIGQSIVCVVCNGVSFGFLKYSVFSGIVAGFRVDTMEHSGFIAAIVSGSTNNRGSMCAGKSGGTAASVFLSWDATTSPAPSVPLYRIDIAASATTYNPATWPATNPGITWTTVGTVNVSAVDPAWAGFSVFSLGYDLADGNVLMLAGTTNQADGHRILKLNAVTAAVMWNIAIGVVIVDLAGSRINGSLWMFRNAGAGAGPTDSYRINTLTGTMQTQPLTGVFAGANTNRQQSDSERTLMLFGGNFKAGSGAPNPVEGTSTYADGFSVMGGQTTRTTVVGSDRPDRNLIWLSASDDRGRSFGNPVSQTMGEAGEYRTSISWNRLGMARDRVFRLEWSVPAPTALQGAWIEVTPAGS